jgi:hypothetical protein
MTVTLLYGHTPAYWHSVLCPPNNVPVNPARPEYGYFDRGAAGDATPGSRYGSIAGRCARWAIAYEFVAQHHNGGSDAGESEGLDYSMSLAVNDSPDIAELVYEYWFVIPRSIRQSLGYRRSEVKRMMG